METPTPESSAVAPSLVDASIQPESAEPASTPQPENVSTFAESESQHPDAGNKDDIAKSTETITVEDLASYTGVDATRFTVNDEGQLMYQAKVGGKIESVPIKDALDNYQQRSHLAKENRETVELKKSLKTQQASDRERVEAKLQMAEDVTTLAYQDLQGEIESENWEQLYEDDPALYAAKKAKHTERAEGLQQRYAKLVEARQQNQPDISQDRAQMAAKLIEVIPGWDVDATAQKEYKEINEYALSKGFEQGHISTLVDHRLVELLHKSMKYDQLLAQKVSITKAVRKSPKLAKAGSPSGEKTEAPKTMEELFYGT